MDHLRFRRLRPFVAREIAMSAETFRDREKNQFSVGFAHPNSDSPRTPIEAHAWGFDGRQPVASNNFTVTGNPAIGDASE